MTDPWAQAGESSQLSFLHVEELQEAPENPRDIRPERFEALKYALQADPTMMLARPVIADVTDRAVVCGNMRLRAVKALGWTRVPTFLHKFEGAAQRREWMLRDNQEYGDYVPSELAALVKQHEAEGADMRLLGFQDQELADLARLGEPDIPDAGDAAEDEVTAVWGIVIDCEDEAQQGELLEEFAERGLKTRALMV